VFQDRSELPAELREDLRNDPQHGVTIRVPVTMVRRKQRLAVEVAHL
jgi:hypothetical protein